MIYPIVAYGDPVLRKKAVEIEKGSIEINELANDMFETMYNANGVAADREAYKNICGGCESHGG